LVEEIIPYSIEYFLGVREEDGDDEDMEDIQEDDEEDHDHDS